MNAPANLPCPFCGSKELRWRYTTFGDAISCDTCKAIGPTSNETEAEAWESWNHRTLGRSELVDTIPAPVLEDSESCPDRHAEKVAPGSWCSKCGERIPLL